MCDCCSSHRPHTRHTQEHPTLPRLLLRPMPKGSGLTRLAAARQAACAGPAVNSPCRSTSTKVCHRPPFTSAKRNSDCMPPPCIPSSAPLASHAPAAAPLCVGCHGVGCAVPPRCCSGTSGTLKSLGHRPGIATSQGTPRERVSPRPNCPYSFQPQAHSVRRSWLRASECREPHETCTGVPQHAFGVNRCEGARSCPMGLI
mmetsp:Transcript_27417/g.81258  ORF Transcript_27417/g.81258 Transcript_27417/m.81258 type:complete len:201 (+) Transcript_27417:872-1474(+)